MDSAPNARNSGNGVDRQERLKAEPTPASRSRAGRLVSALLPVLLGGGSLFSVVQWILTGPQYDRRLKELKADQAQLQNEAAKQTAELNKTLSQLSIADRQMAILKKAHEEELQTVKELERLRREPAAHRSALKTDTDDEKWSLSMSYIGRIQRLELVIENSISLPVDPKTIVSNDRPQNHR